MSSTPAETLFFQMMKDEALARRVCQATTREAFALAVAQAGAPDVTPETLLEAYRMHAPNAILSDDQLGSVVGGDATDDLFEVFDPRAPFGRR